MASGDLRCPQCLWCDVLVFADCADSATYGGRDYEVASTGLMVGFLAVTLQVCVLVDFVNAVDTCGVRVDVDRLVQSFVCENRTRE